MVLQTQLNAEYKIKEAELKNIIGGFTFSAAFLSAISRGVSTVFEIGRSFGSALRRSLAGKICPL